MIKVFRMTRVTAWAFYSHGKDSGKRLVLRHALKTDREGAMVMH